MLFPLGAAVLFPAFHAEEIGALAPCKGGRMMLETGGRAWQGSSQMSMVFQAFGIDI